MIYTILLLGCMFQCVGAIQTQQLTFKAPFATNHGKIKSVVADSLQVERITFESDTHIEREELLYLLSFNEGDTINAKVLADGVSYLGLKNKFEEIRFVISPGVNGVWLHIYLRGFWTFRSLKVKGLLRGKESLKQQYIMESGDKFDKTKHELSIGKIRSIFTQDGYFKSSIQSSFDYDYVTKSIDVTLHIHRGNRFRMGKVQLDVSVDDSELQDELPYIKKQLYNKLLKRLYGSYYSKDILNDRARSIRRYLSQKGFLHTSMQLREDRNKKKGRVNITFIIVIHQKRSFVFFGNHFFSQRQLMDTILEFGRSAWLLPASILAEEIVRMYHSKGFWEVHVDPQEEGGRYFLIIREGPRAIIQDIELQQISFFSHEHIKKKCFSSVLRRKYYDEALITEAFRLLREAYVKEGFLSFSVVGYTLVQIDQTDKYKLVVTIEEGKRSYLQKILIPSFPELLHEGPFAKCKGEKGNIPFNTDRINEQRQWLMQRLYKDGYTNVVVKTEIEEDAYSQITLTYVISYGESARFGKTVIQGSSTFPFSSVMRELRYNEDEVWDQERIRNSFLSLKRLDVFDTIYFNPVQEIHGKRPQLLKLKHGDPFELRLRGGLALEHVQNYQTLDGVTYKLGGAFLVKNPFNAGDQIRIDTNFTRVHREILCKYIRPWFLGIPLRSIVQGYSIKYDQPPFVGSDKNVYTVTQQGFLFGVNGKNNYFEGGINAGIEWMETSISDTVLANQLSRALNFEPRLLDTMIPFLFIEPTLFIDYLDNKLDPRQGMFTLLSIKGMFPLNSSYFDSYFVRLLVEQSFFWPLGPLVGALRVRFGHEFHRKFSAIMPSERFYLGGSRSIRGFDADLAPPLSNFVDEKGEAYVVPRGGKSMVNLNCEVRFPLFKKVGGVIFSDLGLLSGDDFADFKPENVQGGSGFGIRFYTPLGPLRFDIGWKWRKPDPSARSFAWYLTFGHAF